MALEKLDLKGMACPMPIVEIARLFKKLDHGDIAEIEADDPAFEPDIMAWVKRSGHKIVKFEQSADVFHCTLCCVDEE